MLGFLLRVLVISGVVFVIWWWFFMSDDAPDQEVNETLISLEENDQATTSLGEVKEDHKELINAEEEGKPDDSKEVVVEEIELPQKINHKVPFVVQAPKAQWSDERFQDACEEASLLMAHRWRSGDRGLSKNAATDALEDMFAREALLFAPDTIDTSAEDTARFGEEYFGGDFDVKKNITLDDMYRVLADGALIIIPTNGKKLGNPNFSNGGPERHMLVVTGYDMRKKEFITNDPGTRKGEKYHYNVSTLYNAIRDYPTGHKVPITEVHKTMIVVEKL